MGEIVATKQLEGVTLTVEKVDPPWGPPPYYYGYARFDENPLPDNDYDLYYDDPLDDCPKDCCTHRRLDTHVRVHGTIIHMKKDDNGCMVYGFHTGWLGYQRNPNYLSKQWTLEEAERMALAIIALGDSEKQLIAAMDEIWGNDGQM